MIYSREMVDLVKEARRRAPSEDKPSIKLANPDLLKELIRLYHASRDTVFRTLIKEVMHLAGDPWPTRLELRTDEPVQDTGRFQTRVYRGQTTLVERPSMKTVSALSQAATPPPKPKRIYRGQVVA